MLQDRLRGDLLIAGGGEPGLGVERGPGFHAAVRSLDLLLLVVRNQRGVVQDALRFCDGVIAGVDQSLRARFEPGLSLRPGFEDQLIDHLFIREDEGRGGRDQR